MGGELKCILFFKEYGLLKRNKCFWKTLENGLNKGEVESFYDMCAIWP
jgi:hypothetical protein